MIRIYHGWASRGWEDDGTHGRITLLACPEDGCPGDCDPDSRLCRDCNDKDECIEHQTCAYCGEKNYYCDWEDKDLEGNCICPDCKNELEDE